MRRFGPLLALVVLCATLGVLSSHFLTWDNLINVCRQSAVNALLALGQLVVIITAGIDLSVGSILGLCCVLAALLLKSRCPADPGRVGRARNRSRPGRYVNGLLLTKLRLPHPFIPTLGMMNVARGLALVISGGFPISELPPGFRFWGAGSLAWIPAPLLVVALFGAAFHMSS